MSIPDETIEQVRDAADIVDVVGEHVQLKRTGTDYRGPCPFHGGTHRNLAVIPKKQMFYCFVCHEGGDVFTFYMKKFGMDYPTAVREVARKVGITIPERPTGGPDPREPLYGAVAVAHEWYARQLREAKDAETARRYLADRGFPLDSVLPYGLGYASGGGAFLSAMATLGVGEDVLLQAGLAVRRDEGPVRARFWNRLLFPIHDQRGRVVGFGGRVIGEGEPKYLNSPDSEIFHKGRLLYNLHDAKHAIRKAEHAVLVEGYFDVLRLVEAGMEHVVAPLGTGFTSEQGQLLRRLTDRVTLLFDSDSAGLRATFRTADVLLSEGVRVSVATMPEGEDPDTLVQRGGLKAMETVLHDALDVLERKLQLLERKGWLGNLQGRRRALDRLLPTLRAVSDPVTRDLYTGRVAEALGITRESVVREIEQGIRMRPAAAPYAAGGADAPDRVNHAGPGGGRPERDLVRVLVHVPEWRSRIAEQLPAREYVKEPEATLLDALAGVAAEGAVAPLLQQLEAEPRTLLAALLEEPWGAVDVDAVVAAALTRLESRPLERELRELDRRIPLAAEADKPELLKRKDALSRQLSKMNPARWNVIRRGRSSAR
ncbi:MAG TPA: DNA primase [Gemmatimonadales bacterium]|nr:DNA primase [Gemmatimonadales bacterium]